jgi:hypothetical protein
MEADTPPSVANPVHRRRMRNAWIALGAYLFMRIISNVLFEWNAYVYGRVDAPLPAGLLIDSFIIGSFIAFIRMAFKRAFAPALIYAFIVFNGLIFPYAYIHSFVMDMKARIFAAYPNLCQTPIDPNKRVSICYRYYVNTELGEDARIYFNPGDELLLPPQRWPEDIKREVSPLYVETCMKHVAGHVYWISGPCRNN